MTLKVWCEKCRGSKVVIWHKEDGDHSAMKRCPTCGGRGYTLREAIEVGAGKTVVATKSAIEAAAAVHAGEEAPPGCSDEEYWGRIGEEARECHREEVVAILRTLCGGVRLANAVGTVEYRPIVPYDIETQAAYVGETQIKEGDEVAVLDGVA